MGRKKKTNNYFDEKVEEAVHLYNLSLDDRERNNLFKLIYPALAKLAQVWRNKIKPTYIEMPEDELEMECITFLMEKLPMVKKGKGKAFSYLTVTARNFYILGNQQAYSKKKKSPSIETMSEKFDVEDIPSDRVQEMELNAKLFDTFIEYVNDNFDTMFSSSQQKEFATSLLSKIKDVGLGEDFNRRKMLNEVTKETGIPRGLVTKHVNRVASFYSTFKNYYEVYGVKPQFKEKIYLTESDEEYIRKHYQHYSKKFGLMGISRQLGIRYETVREFIKQSDI